MQRPEFVELRRELRSRGYSRRYITRLLAELSDHYQCTQEAYSELDPPSGTGLQNDNASEQECTLERMPSELGSVNILSDAVDAHPELMPISRQHPWLVFLWLPGSLVVIYTALMSQVVASAIEFLPKSSFAAAMPHVPNIFFACDLVFLTLVLLVSAAMR
ncbi:MAG TPA: hypothetical protein DDW52_15445, partial [Planctomycetaceae bacterium]|nr:hypothetical protein [Planctomycetaceae bacterium]